MKMKRETLMMLILGVIGGFGVFWGKKYTTQVDEKLYSNPDLKFTIGMVTKYLKGGTKASQLADYIFIDNGIEYNGSMISAPVPDEGVEIGDKYLVCYVLKDGKPDSRMLFDYPIRDSADFSRELSRWKTFRSDNDKANERLFTTSGLKYAIGTVLDIEKALEPHFRGPYSRVDYDFEVNGEFVEVHTCKQLKDVFVGDKFLVVYVTRDGVVDSRMLFDYPARDSADLNREVERWKAFRLQQQRKK